MAETAVDVKSFAVLTFIGHRFGECADFTCVLWVQESLLSCMAGCPWKFVRIGTV